MPGGAAAGTEQRREAAPSRAHLHPGRSAPPLTFFRFWPRKRSSASPCTDTSSAWNQLQMRCACTHVEWCSKNLYSASWYFTHSLLPAGGDPAPCCSVPPMLPLRPRPFVPLPCMGLASGLLPVSTGGQLPTGGLILPCICRQKFLLAVQLGSGGPAPWSIQQEDEGRFGDGAGSTSMLCLARGRPAVPRLWGHLGSCPTSHPFYDPTQGPSSE